MLQLKVNVSNMYEEKIVYIKWPTNLDSKIVLPMRFDTSLPDMVGSPLKGNKLAPNGNPALSTKMPLKFSISRHKDQKASNKNDREKENPQIGIFRILTR